MVSVCATGLVVVGVAVGLDGVEAVEGGVEGWVFEEFVLGGRAVSAFFSACEFDLGLQREWVS